jgi:hypothetical protein
MNSEPTIIHNEKWCNFLETGECTTYYQCTEWTRRVLRASKHERECDWSNPYCTCAPDTCPCLYKILNLDNTKNKL